jgi:flagellar basal-body rod protein FlgF
MTKGLYVALSGAVVQEQAMDISATNVANSSSAGYQRMRPVFRQALASAVGDGEMRYAKTAKTAVDTTPGATRVTNNPLDVALPEGVYLAAITPRGERFTRAGNLALDSEGTLKTASGTPVSGEGGAPIKGSPGGGLMRIDPDGTVKQGTTTLGKLKLVTFETPSALQHEGSGLMTGEAAGAQTPSKVPITVGAVEESNSAPVAAMTEMMQASRTFEAFQKVLDQFGEIDRKLMASVPQPVE